MIDERLYEEHVRNNPEHSNDQSDREDSEERAHDHSFPLRTNVVPNEPVAIGAAPDR